jgi:hypothetical protein
MKEVKVRSKKRKKVKGRKLNVINIFLERYNNPTRLYIRIKLYTSTRIILRLVRPEI